VTLPLYSANDTSPVRSPIKARGILDPVFDFVASLFQKTGAAVQAGVGGFEALDEEYSSLFWNTVNAGIQQGPSANYNQNSNAADLNAVDQQTINEEVQIVIPCTALGPVANFFPAVLDCNGFALIPRKFDESTGTELQSSDSARIYVRFNSVSNPWIPFSLSTEANPLQADFTGIARPIRRVWIRVTNLAADSAFPFLIVSFLKNVSLTQGGGAPQIYSVPSGSPAQGSPQAAQRVAGGVGPGTGAGVPAPGGGIGGGGVNGGGGRSGGGGRQSLK